jgi:hypothetical protein
MLAGPLRAKSGHEWTGDNVMEHVAGVEHLTLAITYEVACKRWLGETITLR